MKKNEPRRFVKLEGLDTTLELTKVVQINKVQKRFIYLEEMDNGTWRLTYTENVIPDITKLQSMNIIRLDGVDYDDN
jgi:hypothetical protein